VACNLSVHRNLYSEVLTVPQVNQIMKLCKNELNICKLCASDMCVTIFMHRNI